MRGFILIDLVNYSMLYLTYFYNLSEIKYVCIFNFWFSWAFYYKYFIRDVLWFRYKTLLVF